MNIAGIDYSMSCPAICVCDKDNISFSNCHIYYITSMKKYSHPYENICPIFYKDWETDIERYDFLSQTVIDILAKHDVERVFIEGYSYGSKGLQFNVGELTGILKYKLLISNICAIIIPPSKVKKYATGKGNANKFGMNEAFEEEFKLSTLNKIYEVGKSPLADMIDAFYIMKCGEHDIT